MIPLTLLKLVGMGKLIAIFFELFLQKFENMFLSSSSVKLLTFYHVCHSLIGYATYYLLCYR